MARRLGIVCAAALLFAAAGCSASSLFLSWVGSGGKQQVIAASLDDVSAHLQASLNKIHILVAVNPMDEDTVKLNGQTKSGKRFALVLKRQKTVNGERTAISIEWEQEADEQFWATVLELLVAPPPTANAAVNPTTGGNAGR
jgi:hypothetical protein